MPEHPVQPSDVFPAFSWERLIIVGEILFGTRLWVANDAKRERGDTRTGIGFRAWEQSKHAIAIAAATQHAGWLSVSDPGPEFMFKIGMMPVRFCRGDSEDALPVNYQTPTLLERAQIEAALTSEGREMVGRIFRFLIDADTAGFPLAVYIAMANESGEVLMAWRIPRPDESSGSTPFVVPREPVMLPALTVQTVAEAEEQAAREEEERRAREQKERDEIKQRKQAKKGA